VRNYECADCDGRKEFASRLEAAFHLLRGHLIVPVKLVERRSDPRARCPHDHDGIWIRRLDIDSATCSMCGFVWVDDPEMGYKPLHSAEAVMREVLDNNGDAA
jgi:hypothetical protein